MQPVNREDRPLSTLFGDLARETSELIRKELQLARAEMGEKLSQVGSGIGSIVVGGAIAYAGFLFLLGALTIGLALLIDPRGTMPWLSPLIVGAVVVLVGVLLLQRGRSELKARNLTPERTIESLRRDRDFAREQFQ